MQMKFRFAFSKNTVFFLAVTLMMVAMIWYGTNSSIEYSPRYSEGVSFPVGKIIDIISNQTEVDEYGLHRGRQDLLVKLISGEHSGKMIEVTNTLTIDHNFYAKIGQRIIIFYDQQPEDDYYFASVQSYERSWTIYILIGLFLCLLSVIGGKTGIRSAFGLIFTFIVIIFFMIPLIINGASSVWISLGTILCIIVVSLISMHGFTKKAYVGILGTSIGVVLCCIFYVLISHLLHITGYSIPEIDSLIVIAYNTNIKVGAFLFCGVLIASLGAVMDVSVSVASSVAELSKTNPEISFEGLLRSGIRIGKDIVGAMANTLILAFTGSFFTTLIILRIYEIQFNHLINLNEVAIEILQAIASSSALILCAPITAFIAARLYSSKFHKPSEPKH
jgi:uncharacterized membrane protein